MTATQTVESIDYTIDPDWLAGIDAYVFERRLGDALAVAYPSADVTIRHGLTVGNAAVQVTMTDSSDTQSTAQRVNEIANDVRAAMCEK